MKIPWIKSKKFTFFFILFICFDSSKQAICGDSYYCYIYDSYTLCSDGRYYECDINCRPRYLSSCFDCTGVSGKFYSIDGSTCKSQCIGDKIIKNYNKNMFECTNTAITNSDNNNYFFRLGDVYYYTGDNELSKMSCKDRICTCKDYYYFEVTNSKKIYTCYQNLNQIPTGYYYNYITKEVFPSDCPDGFKVRKRIDNKNRCSDKCIGNEFRTSQTSGYVTTYECIDGCNSTYPYQYTGNGIRECLQNCPSGSDYVHESSGGDKICYKKEQCDFIDESKKCYFNSCPTAKSYYNTDSNVKRCFTQDDCISKGYRYFINQECRENCDGYYKRFITSNDGTVLAENLRFTKCYETLEKVKGDSYVRYYNANLKRCWVDKPTDIQYYIKREEIVESRTIFELVEECETFYYEKYTTRNSLYCTKDCKTVSRYFLRGNKRCESNCAVFKKYYYDPKTNECVDSCKGVQGYGFENAISPPPSPPSTPEVQECLNNCGTSKFYNYDSNVCITNCQVSGNTRLYYSDDSNVCYPSCIDIPDGLGVIGKYIYELDDYICKMDVTLTECRYYYLQNNGVRRCVLKDVCERMNYIYLIGQKISSTEIIDQCTNA